MNGSSDNNQANEIQDSEGQAISTEQRDDVLCLQDGSNLKIVRSGGSRLEGMEGKSKMPVYDGMVGANHVQVLRDTGCDGVIVKSKFVEDKQFTGKLGYVLRIDNTVIEARKAIINVDTLFLKGKVEALCLSDALYDLIIGNVQGVEPIYSNNGLKRVDGDKNGTQRIQEERSASALVSFRSSSVSDSPLHGRVASRSVSVISDESKKFQNRSEDDEELIPFYPLHQTQTVDHVKISDRLSTEARGSVEGILRKFSDVFTDQPGKCTGAQQEIKLNKVIEFDHQPLESVKEVVREIGNCQFFT